MQTTMTLTEALAAARERSAAKIAVVKPRHTNSPSPVMALTENEKALVRKAAKLGSEWRERANNAGW